MHGFPFYKKIMKWWIKKWRQYLTRPNGEMKSDVMMSWPAPLGGQERISSMPQNLCWHNVTYKYKYKYNYQPGLSLEWCPFWSALMGKNGLSAFTMLMLPTSSSVTQTPFSFNSSMAGRKRSVCLLPPLVFHGRQNKGLFLSPKPKNSFAYRHTLNSTLFSSDSSSCSEDRPLYIPCKGSYILVCILVAFQMFRFFLAVQNSSIGDLFPC